ncbi:MurR/RpiR family transcriptional regulator [Pseudalkalibacillus hwajinpoensis]|uniref:MurR/RpiR family transcriptional regulator n=1 Tax=Guptibacillus hwajinpoensis TaxID=208199 RepID=UPI001CD5D5FE|nr:SIS domain-containing protein [Pseudalkalibacillus hwajinpoensis]MCA0991457.1 SIS domain-containing protein [Pseudalkalibacillus hwajinpoensis]
MIQLDTKHLTKLEEEVHGKLSEVVATNDKLKIIDAAKLCEVSPSKVSKLVRKLGFDNFKQYKLYFSGQQIYTEKRKKSSEIDRLMQFLENFDPALVENFVSVFQKYKKIIIYGLGPSFISAEYFGYKLTVSSDKNVTVAQSEDFASRLADENTLLIVLSVTGKFSSFKNLFTETKKNGATIMLVLEEYVNTLDSMADYIFYLSKFNQDSDLLPFEKTRTVFFIFIEEVIARISGGRER